MDPRWLTSGPIWTDTRSEIMKSYTFMWWCDAAHGTIDMTLTDAELALVKKAFRDGFDQLEDTDYLKDIRERAVRKLYFYDPYADQDIRFYVPEEIRNEVYKEG